MIRIIHLSDLHFGKRRYEDRSKKLLEALVGKYSFTPNGGDFLLVTGDITNSGTEAEYAEALRYLDPFTYKVRPVMGNHDVGRLGLGFDQKCVRRFNKLALSLYPVVPGDGSSWLFSLSDPVVWWTTFVQIILLASPTTFKTNKPLDFAQGCLGKTQLTKLRKILSEEKMIGEVRILALHHRPFDDRYTMKLRDADAFMRIVMDPKYEVDVVCYGHSGSYKQDAKPRGYMTPVISTYPRGDGHVHFVNGNSCVDEGAVNIIECEAGKVSIRREVIL